MYLTVSLYQRSDSLSDDVLILKCMADENFFFTWFNLLIMDHYTSGRVSIYFSCTCMFKLCPAFNHKMFSTCNMYIAIGPSAHTYSTVDHRHEEAHASYVLFRSQADLSLFLFCHAACDESTPINQTMACCSTSYMSAAHPTHSKYF